MKATPASPHRVLRPSVIVATIVFLLLTAALTKSSATVFAAPAPYGTSTTSGTASVSTTNPPAGSGVTVTVTGCRPGDTVVVQIHSAPVTIGTFTANASGVASGVVTIPAGYSGPHTLVATNQRTGVSVSIAIVVGTAAAVADPAAANGGLPFTGVAVVGLGVLAIAFLASGGLMLFLGRRRRPYRAHS